MSKKTTSEPTPPADANASGADKKGYKHLRYEEVPIHKLTKHPLAEMMPTSKEDRKRLLEDIQSHGQLDAVIVNERYQIMDGCTRWDIEKELKHDTIRCQIVADADPRDVLVSKATTGRVQTTGSRLLIMMYAHKEEVLTAANISEGLRDDPSATAESVIADLPAGKRAAAAAAWKEWNTDAIRARIKCSDEDINLARALLLAKLTHVLPPMKAFNDEPKELDSTNPDDVAVIDAVDKAYKGVLSGETPIRRWKASLGGIIPTAGGQGKAETNHSELCLRAMKSLKTAFSNWTKVKSSYIPTLEKHWKEIMADVPVNLEALLVSEARRRNSKI